MRTRYEPASGGEGGATTSTVAEATPAALSSSETCASSDGASQ
jgi:hypothetical protein